MAEAVNAAARRKSDTWNKGQEPGAKGQCEAWHIPVPASRNSSGRFDYKVREESRKGNTHRQQFLPCAEAPPVTQQPVLKGTRQTTSPHLPLPG